MPRMLPWTGRLAAIPGLLALLSAPASGAGTCTPLARLTLRDTAGVLTVDVRLDGRPVAMVLDTGSEGGLVTPEAARHLSVDASTAAPPMALRMYGANGGQTLARVVSVSDLQLGEGADAPHVGLATVPVSRLPFQPMITPPIAGLIGADLLSHFDLDLDVPQARALLYPAGCTPPWSGPTTQRVGLTRIGDRLATAVRLDGQPIGALVDTGARSRVVSLRAALALGIDEAALGADTGGTAAGFGAHVGFYRWHRFRSFAFAGRSEHDVTLTVAALDDVADMLLGADWFAMHRVWISWSEPAMWVAGQSGDQSRVPAAQSAHSPGTSSAPSPTAKP